MFYSKTTKGFHDPEIGVPEDAVEISHERYLELLEGNRQGKVVVPDLDGYPVLTDPEPVVLTYVERRQREYPPVLEQLDAIWKGGNAAEAMRATILGVKAKYPKEG